MGRAVRRMVAVGAAATLSTTIAVAGTGGAPAGAATGGVWSKLSTGSGVGISYPPSVVRYGNKLIVAWVQSSGPNTTALHTRMVASNALPTGAITTAADWASISADPQIFLLGGVPTIAFGGLRTT